MDAAARELESLRARAYGPDADIHDDPAAMQRLHELEEWNRRAEEADDIAPDAPAADAAIDGVPSELVAQDDGGVEASDSADEVVARASHSHMSKRVQVVWALSLVLVAAIAAAVTVAVVAITPVTTATGARQVATLLPDEDYEWPESFFGQETEGVSFEYLGVRVLKTSVGYFTSGNGECMTVFDESHMDEENGSYDGTMMFADCRAGGFPAAVQFIIEPTSPEELRLEFGDGVALQFVLDGDRVGVFTDPD